MEKKRGDEGGKGVTVRREGGYRKKRGKGDEEE